MGQPRLSGVLMASISNLIRGTDREYFDLFERAGANVERAGDLLDEMLAAFPDSHGLANDIRDCERDGDQITHELIERLNRTFVTPIDRQDILDLASSLDDIVLVIVVATALAFDFTNGFHDTANVVATAISTRAIAPKPAVAMAAVLNFVGAFLSLKVAATVGKGFVDTDAITTTVVFAGLVGAIGWNVITWYFGLPSSSSHALIGGLVAAVIAAQGFAV